MAGLTSTHAAIRPRSPCTSNRACSRSASTTASLPHPVRADARLFAVGRGAGPRAGAGSAADRQARGRARRRSSRSATTRCSRASPTATTPASSRGTTCTSSARSRPSCGSSTRSGSPRPASTATRRWAARPPALVVRPLALTARDRAMSDTHFGFSTVDDSAKAERVRGVFDSVAPKYDVMNDLMSLGLHRAWKAYTVARRARCAPATRCSTSPAAPATWRAPSPSRSARRGLVVHTDINEAMLRQGRDRLLDEGIVLPTAALRRRVAAVRERERSTSSASPSACAT